MICGKQIYKTNKEAIEAIKGIMKDDRIVKSNRRASRAYFCDECQGWHLHTENKKEKLRRDRLNQRHKQEVKTDLIDSKTKQNNIGQNTLIIHDARKFKVK